MDSLRQVMLICKIIGIFPIGSGGNFNLGAAITVVVYFVISCSAIVYRSIVILNDSSGSGMLAKFSCGTVIVATVQVFAIPIYLWKLSRYRKICLRLLSINDMSKSICVNRFQIVPICIGPALFSMCLYSAVFLISSRRKFFAATSAFNCFQNFIIVLQYYYFLQGCHVYFPIRKNRNIFRNQLFVFRATGVIMRVFEWPLMLIYANSFGYVVWYMYVALCWPLLPSNKRPSTGGCLFYFSFIAMKVLTMMLPCLASQRIYNLMDEHYDKVYRIMKDNPILYKKTSLFHYVTTKYQIKLRVCGFFTLGHPLITSIIAGCGTYLVVLMQFSPSW